MAELPQNHTRALDRRDANARLEREAYEDLVRQQRAIASSLSALAGGRHLVGERIGGRLHRQLGGAIAAEHRVDCTAERSNSE